ncbi:hypothetical protein THUN1379_27000 [Paludibacterium sp. THUN1379]|nr:hypothetical protein THUN1379_27000 [Paludibacterium sp. THUN1379]
MTELSADERYWLQRVLDDTLGDEAMPAEIADSLQAQQLIAWSHAAACYVRGIRASAADPG